MGFFERTSILKFMTAFYKSGFTSKDACYSSSRLLQILLTSFGEHPLQNIYFEFCLNEALFLRLRLL